MTKEDIDRAIDDPRFLAFAAGYNAAREKFSNPPGELHYITNEIDSFLAWRREQ